MNDYVPKISIRTNYFFNLLAMLFTSIVEPFLHIEIYEVIFYIFQNNTLELQFS